MALVTRAGRPKSLLSPAVPFFLSRGISKKSISHNSNKSRARLLVMISNNLSCKFISEKVFAAIFPLPDSFFPAEADWLNYTISGQLDWQLQVGRF